MNKWCKKCGREVEGEYVEVEESRELVVVEEERLRAIVLSKGDCLCPACHKAVTFYRRIKI